jgi:hypothetical protein
MRIKEMIGINNNSNFVTQIKVLGESYHLGDKINFVLKESNGQVIGFLASAGPANIIDPQKYSSDDRVIVYTAGYKNDGLYEVLEKEIAKVEIKKYYPNSKEFDWE